MTCRNEDVERTTVATEIRLEIGALGCGNQLLTLTSRLLLTGCLSIANGAARYVRIDSTIPPCNGGGARAQ